MDGWTLDRRGFLFPGLGVASGGVSAEKLMMHIFMGGEQEVEGIQD